MVSTTARRGIRIYLATPSLVRAAGDQRHAVASAGALVIMNTGLHAGWVYGLDNQWAMAWPSRRFGAVRWSRRLRCQKLLDSIPRSNGVLGGASLLAVGTLAAAALGYGWLLPLWFLLGVGYSTAQTPSGRLLRRSAIPKTGRRCSPRSSRFPMPAG